MRILHTSDCHLGTSFPGAEERAFAAAIDLALDERVDLFLVAGDLFDSSRLSDEIVEWAAREIDRLPCPVVAIPGNHDALVAESILWRLVSRRNRHTILLDQPEGAVVRIPDSNIAVWGRALTEHSPSYSPLQGLPARPDEEFCIAIAHGLVQDDERRSGRSSPILPSELAVVDWDYLALGHCHRVRQISHASVPAFYSGATAESVDGHPAVLLVDFDGGGPPDVKSVRLFPPPIPVSSPERADRYG